MSDNEKKSKDTIEQDQNQQKQNKPSFNPMGGGKRNIYMRKKVCRFCNDKKLKIDYKNVDILRRFTTEGGKIIPRRISGNCAKHQRMVAKEIKVARYIALLPYVKK